MVAFMMEENHQLSNLVETNPRMTTMLGQVTRNYLVLASQGHTFSPRTTCIVVSLFLNAVLSPSQSPTRQKRHLKSCSSWLTVSVSHSPPETVMVATAITIRVSFFLPSARVSKLLGGLRRFICGWRPLRWQAISWGWLQGQAVDLTPWHNGKAREREKWENNQHLHDSRILVGCSYFEPRPNDASPMFSCTNPSDIEVRKGRQTQ